MNHADRPDVLRAILRRKHEEVEARRAMLPIGVLHARAAAAAPVRGFAAALERHIAAGGARSWKLEDHHGSDAAFRNVRG